MKTRKLFSKILSWTLTLAMVVGILPVVAIAEDGEVLPPGIREVAIVPMSDLHGMQAAQAKGYETVFSIDLSDSDENIDAPPVVSLPYTLKQDENPAAVRIWHMDDDGNLTDLNGTYPARTSTHATRQAEQK